jgi:nucleoside-diphosphate-sugar epimerase
MKRVLVTGATGFVGANLARRLLEDGHEVHLTLRPGHKPWRLDAIRSDVQLHEAAVEDRPRVGSVFDAVRPEWVFHLAVHGAYSSETDVEQMLRTNVLGTASVLAAAQAVGCESFVNAGTSSEYGFKDHAPDESEALEPNSDYAVTKASATMYCRHVARRTGARIVTLRLYSAYGPWEEPTRLIPTIAVRGLDGRLSNLASPDIARDFVYVDEVVDAFIAAAQRDTEPGAIFNIATGVQTTLADVVDVVRAELGVRDQPIWGSMRDRAWDTSVWVGNGSRAADGLGWSPTRTFREGLLEFVDWLRADTARLDFYRQRIADG